MSRTDVFDDIDTRTASYAEQGVAASRKVGLASATVPYSTLDAAGVEIPHRDYLDDREEAVEYPTTITFEDTSVVDESNGTPTRVHLHQDVREDMDEDAFGDFGAVEDDADDEDVIWTVVDLTDGTVTLTVVGDWGRRRDVPFAEFPEEYDPLYLADGAPRFGY